MAQLGAYYYLWYDKDQWDRWKSIHTPRIGFYDSSNQEVVTQHITWAKNYGIKFLVIGWAGPESKADQNLKNAFLVNPHSHEIQFAILYETEARLKDSPGDSMNLDDPRKANRLIDDLSYCATQYFDDERYFKLDERPILVVYLSRDLKGNVEAVIQKLRSALARHNPYIIGDEVYWGRLARDLLRRARLSDLDTRRIKSYDAVTAYNMHTSSRKILDSFEKDVAREFDDWAQALSKIGVDFVPSAIPGFNDTKILERRNIPLERSVERFNRLLQAATRPLTRHQLVLITSFNEWHEDTQIEPAMDYGPQEVDRVSYLDTARRYG